MLEHPYPAPLLVARLLMVAAVEVPPAIRDPLPQFANRFSLGDVHEHLPAIEEEGGMDVVAHVLPLLHCTDVARLVLEDRIVFPSPDQPVQVLEDVLYLQASTRCFPVVQIHPHHHSTRTAIHHPLYVLGDGLPITFLPANTVMLPTLEPLGLHVHPDPLHEPVVGLSL
ncbi:hypothetical protein PSE305_29220 [Pseudomonas aeruginosa]|nr:hypothetical protein PSE305_29220 [Pseudomonas aeruginosa]